MSRGRVIDLSGPQYYQDLLTGIALEILDELAELEKLDMASMGEDAFDEVVGITQIRLLNELYYGLGRFGPRGWSTTSNGPSRTSGTSGTARSTAPDRPAVLKFQVEAEEEQVQ